MRSWKVEFTRSSTSPAEPYVDLWPKVLSMQGEAQPTVEGTQLGLERSPQRKTPPLLIEITQISPSASTISTSKKKGIDSKAVLMFCGKTVFLSKRKIPSRPLKLNSLYCNSQPELVTTCVCMWCLNYIMNTVNSKMHQFKPQWMPMHFMLLF